jgi:hypothetical protein
MELRMNFLWPAVVTGLIAGTLDLAGAIVNYMLFNGRFPFRILEYIASAAFGSGAMDGSLGSNLWGLFFHYLIATSLSIFYFFIFPGSKLLHLNIWVSAILYGLFAWGITNMIILPLSALQSPVVPRDWTAAASAMFVLIVCIGLPIAYCCSRFYRGKERRTGK